MLAIVGPEVANHSVEFCEATTSPREREALLNGAKLLAMTAVDYLTSEALRKQVVAEFKRSA